MAGLIDRKRWGIRRVFLSRRESYTRRWVASTLAVPLGSLALPRYTWPDLLRLAVSRWGLPAIEEVLASGPDPHESVTLSLPMYQVALLAHFAASDRMTPDRYLSELLTAHVADMIAVERACTPAAPPRW